MKVSTNPLPSWSLDVPFQRRRRALVRVQIGYCVIHASSTSTGIIYVASPLRHNIPAMILQGLEHLGTLLNGQTAAASSRLPAPLSLCRRSCYDCSCPTHDSVRDTKCYELNDFSTSGACRVNKLTCEGSWRVWAGAFRVFRKVILGSVLGKSWLVNNDSLRRLSADRAPKQWFWQH